MKDFNSQQIDYIESSINSSIYLEACPGSGKTEVIAAKIVKEINNWTLSPGGIALLSFSNSATDELLSRVQQHSINIANKFPHFIGTFDSFIFKFLINPNAKSLTHFAAENNNNTVRIIEATSPLFIQTKYAYNKRGKIKAHHYTFDRKNNCILFNSDDSELDRIRNSIKWEQWQLDDLIKTKHKLFESGFMTHDDSLYLAAEIFIDEKYKDYASLLSKRFPLIVIDECQDLSSEHLFILQGLNDLGVKLHFVGDLDQSIYGFRDVDPKDTIKFIADNKFKKMPLKINYRSCQQIIDLCSKLTSTGEVKGRFCSIESPCVVLQYNETPLELIDNIGKLCLDYSNNVIVARGHSILEKFTFDGIEGNQVKNLVNAINYFSMKETQNIKKSLQLLSVVIRSKLNYPIRESIFNCPTQVESSVQWRTFLFNTLDFLARNNLHDFEITWSTWCKNANKILSIIHQQPFVSEDLKSIAEEVFSSPIKSPTGLAKLSVSGSIKTNNTNNESYKYATIHSVKGETHDVTILLSSSSNTGKTGSHWKQWINNPNSEAARFAYVASSRPRYKLIWGVKKLKKDEIVTLKNLGFTIM
ncbi:TPA: UvrD-helicase domain-containing protein [Escherichia coli]|uniref:UvrD-helicase domain-containing protein n=1 Tax=Enterobacteriaceae TaxID=543 RepID=UPI000B49C938|nr:ATP-dependent helicase [Escherichia coli]EFG2186910.1 ATP-dependent helicase [Escherichia coli]EFG2188679.1 ATP-dependent helicase [Escherichia coli]EFG2636094.1 ATP-dependent helicase [Escherichia coli]EFG2637736.1 ATP-dependent helicase [Escherichia coli]EGI4369750.1 ATP-dependent helicase [Escherichia coli]